MGLKFTALCSHRRLGYGVAESGAGVVGSPHSQVKPFLGHPIPRLPHSWVTQGHPIPRSPRATPFSGHPGPPHSRCQQAQERQWVTAQTPFPFPWDDPAACWRRTGRALRDWGAAHRDRTTAGDFGVQGGDAGTVTHLRGEAEIRKRLLHQGN